MRNLLQVKTLFLLQKMYKKSNIGFIISETDTVASYEKKGKENVERVWEEAASTISQMNRVQQVELMQGDYLNLFVSFTP